LDSGKFSLSVFPDRPFLGSGKFSLSVFPGRPFLGSGKFSLSVFFVPGALTFFQLKRKLQGCLTGSGSPAGFRPQVEFRP
jgi:hypothetical protein